MTGGVTACPRGRAASVVVLAMLVAGPDARAQGPSPDAREGLRLGPTLLRPVIDVSDVGYETNVLRDPGRGRADVVGALGGRLVSRTVAGPVRLETSSRARQTYLRRHSNLQSLDQWHEAAVRVETARLTLGGRTAVEDVRDRYNFEIEERVRRERVATEASIAWRATPRTTMAIDVTRATITFDQAIVADGISLQPVLGRRRTQAGATMTWQVTPLTAIGGRVAEERTRFAAGVDRNTRSRRAAVTLGLKPGASGLRGDVEVGRQWLRPDGGAMPALAATVARVALQVRAGGATLVEVSGDRDLEYAYQVTHPVYTLTTGQVGLVRRLGPRWQVDGGIGSYHLAYTAVAVPGGPSAARPDDRGITVRGSVRYRLSRRVQVVIRARALERLSADVARRLSARQIGATIEYGFF